MHWVQIKNCNSKPGYCILQTVVQAAVVHNVYILKLVVSIECVSCLLGVVMYHCMYIVLNPISNHYDISNLVTQILLYKLTLNLIVKASLCH